MLTVTFYETRAERNWTNKLANIAPLTGLVDPVQVTLKDGTSILRPRILLALTGNLKEVASTDLLSVNYVYIKEFKRYYFVDDIQIVRTGLFEFTLSYDPLPYFAALGDQYGMVSRYEFGDSRLTDNKRPFYNYDTVYQTNKDGNNLAVNDLSDIWIFVTLGINHYPDIVNSYLNFFKSTQTIEFSPYNNNTLIIAFTNWNQYWKFLKSGVFDDTKITPYVLSMRVYPINPSLFGTGFDEVELTTLESGQQGFKIPVGDTDISITAYQGKSYCMYVTSDMSNPALSTFERQFSLDNLSVSNDYTDFEPYCKRILHLPWLGDVDIDSKLLLSDDVNSAKMVLKVQGSVDWSIGELTYKVYLESTYSKRELFINSCTIGSQIPFTYNNSADVERLNNKYTAQMITQSVVSAGMFAAGLATFVGTPAKDKAAKMLLSPITNALGGLSGAAQSGFEMITNVPQGQMSSSASNFNNGILSDTYIYVSTYKSEKVYIDIDGYKHLCGLPYNRVVKLNTLQNDAYAEIVGVHIPLSDGITDAYGNFVNISFPEEADLLATELANGVIIKGVS